MTANARALSDDVDAGSSTRHAPRATIRSGRIGRGSRTCRTGDPGFVLLELVLALLVASLVAALALPWASYGGTADLHATGRQIVALLRADRNAALRVGRPVVTAIDPSAGTIRSGLRAEAVVVPARYRVSISGTILDGVRFYPDGHARGGEIALAATARPDGARVTVRIEDATAAVELRDRRSSDAL